MVEESRELAVLAWVVLGALVAVAGALAALLRSGRSVPPLAGDGEPRRRRRRPPIRSRLRHA